MKVLLFIFLCAQFCFAEIINAQALPTETQIKVYIDKLQLEQLSLLEKLVNINSGTVPPTANNIELLKKYSEASISLGYGSIIALDPALRGAADISHVALITQANLDGLGPVGTGAHSEKETLDIKSLPIQTQKAAILMYRLANDY